MGFKRIEVTDQNGHKTEFLEDIDTGKLYKRTGLVSRDFPGCQIVEEEVKQEPKTVIYSGEYFDGYRAYGMAECPNCGYSYEEDDKDWGLKFCPNCGQSLNWESEG